MSRRTVYLSGVVGTDAAGRLERLALDWGLAPVTARAQPKPEMSADELREVFEAESATARAIGAAGGHLWVVLEPGDRRTVASSFERAAYLSGRAGAFSPDLGNWADGGKVVERTWRQWLEHMRGANG